MIKHTHIDVIVPMTYFIQKVAREYIRLSSLLAAKDVSGERRDVCIRRLERRQNQKISTIFLLILNY